MAPTNQSSNPTIPASPRPATSNLNPNTIAIFTQLKKIAESGCKLNPDLYYAYQGYPEHALQFGTAEYTLLTGQERPDLEWERACQIYLARKNIPRELVTLPPGPYGLAGDEADPDPRKNKYVMAGVPFEKVKRDKDGNGNGKVLITSVEKGGHCMPQRNEQQQQQQNQPQKEGQDHREERGLEDGDDAEEGASTPSSVESMGGPKTP